MSARAVDGTPHGGREPERARKQEIWIAWIRLAAVPWAVFEVGLNSDSYPEGYEGWAWVTTLVLSAGALAFIVLAYRDLTPRARSLVGYGALSLDTAVILSYYFIYAFEPQRPTRALIYLVVIEAALRYAVRGGLVLPLAIAPVLVLCELWRADRFDGPDFELRDVTVPLGAMLVMGAIVGGLVRQLRGETAIADERAAEAESLRDHIGRRADQLEAVNRCARALSSSLETDEAFRLFLREARAAFDFDRLALVTLEGDRLYVLANAGVAEETILPKGTSRPLAGSLAAEAIETGRTLVRDDMEADPRYAEEPELVEAGVRSRVMAPLPLGDRMLGILSVSRREPAAFDREEVDMITLLGRQVATAVENMRVFAAERSAAEELRRLSALRADFVSLVSHELRAPMASVIGSASTLRQRWRTLAPGQRESFLGLIEEETSRLATLIGDVLDTSRLDAGTFSYTFKDVDVAELVRETASVAAVAQEEVRITAEVESHLPVVHGDRERLRQLLMNLLANAVKYTVPGDEVTMRAHAENGAVSVVVRDNGPGIASEDHRLIFEKFGRTRTAAGSKPGAGLGLYIARSIAEAHGGSLDVDSEPGAGATFVLSLPARSASPDV
jgi:signal transduction histidine kinase